MDAIKTASQLFLDRGIVTEGYTIIQNSPEIQETYIKYVGSLLVTELSSQTAYVVDYEQLTPLHGSSVDDIHIITSTRTLT